MEHPNDSTPPPPAEPAVDTAENTNEQADTATTNTSETNTTEDPLTTALKEVERWKDLAYRNAAELDNFRKRMARETQEARAYANADLLRSLFPILDNFEMGLEAARAESEKSVIFMGMSMVHRQIVDFLRDSNVQEINPLGQPFDPNLHDAVSQEASDTAAEGIVLRVARKGFALKDRLLRPASVIVSSGAPTETPPA